MRWENFGTNIGFATIIPDHPVVVNTPGMWKIVYTVGSKEIAVGGCVRMTIPYGFSPPQISYPMAIGFTTAETSNSKAQVSISLGKDPVTGKVQNSVWGVNVFLTISGHLLREGDTVTLIYGSTEHRPANVGALSQYFEQEVEFTVAVDVDGRRSAPHSGFLLLEKQPKLRVISDVGSQLSVVVPSKTVVGEPFDVAVTVRDDEGNVAYDYNGKVSIKLNGEVLTHHFDAEDRGSHIFHDCVFDSPRVYRLEAEGTGGIWGQSNPTRCTDVNTEQQLYWGDIHAMTSLSAGLGTPDEAYEYGKRYSHLDFCAVTDGDHADNYLTDEDWKNIKSAARKHHNPGNFITFLAYECHERRFAGDKNIYYCDDDAPLIRWSDLDEPGKPTQLWEALRGRRAITVPHHTLPSRFRTWDYHNPEFQRLVEIYSIWGCSEMETSSKAPFWSVHPDNSVQSALNQGHRLGIIASSDSHDGHSGYSDWLRIRRGYHGGLVAVCAKELTREAIFEALWNRHCYGTTGDRIILDFSINGHPMGTEIRSNEPLRTRRISVRVSGTAPVERIDVVRNGLDAYTHVGESAEEEFNWVDEEEFDTVCLVPKDGEPFIYYYIRVTQTNDEMAWSSPIWILP